jgi:two-component system, chemotaxis family, sensor kinase CheA
VTSIHERLAAAFRVEHAEHLQAVRGMLAELARADYDTARFDFAEAHRRVHSLKGAARVVGQRTVESLAHRLESLMAQAQAGTSRLDRGVATTIERAFDAIEDCVAAGEGVVPESAAAALSAIDGLLSASVPPPQAPAAGGADAAIPAPLPRERVGAPVAAAETARVDVSGLDGVLRHSGELLVECGRSRRIADELRRLDQAVRALQRERQGPADGDATDGRLRAIAEQLRQVSALQQDASWRLRRLGRALGSDVRAMRIVAADSVFGGLRKMVRDLAAADGKEVEVTVTGLEVRVDRQVLQALGDPVMHLLRNAVGHGIETPAQRLAAGKPAAGSISVRFVTERNALVVRVEDDGPGLDRESIAGEAVRRGLLAEGAAAAAGLDDLLRLLVQPGFTTARTVTEIAGRGIGLSVVDRAVRQLQGLFTVAPGSRGGTLATITVPLSVSGIQLLLVRCLDHVYAIPVHGVSRLVRATGGDVISVQDEPVLALADDADPVPLASLAQLLGHADAGVNRGDQELLVVLFEHEGSVLGIQVDGLVAVEDGVVHDLDAVVPGIESASGGVLLDDGSVAIVLGPAALMRAARATRRRWSAVDAGAGRAAAAPLILVVDDSITTRTLEKSVLEARGFRVRLSVDGVDALAQLRQERPDLVIADIEMPRMDGFELLHAMKGDSALASLPVILVTSRDSDEDRRKGLALGADAYIIKQRFDQTELIETIGQIV